MKLRDNNIFFDMKGEQTLSVGQNSDLGFGNKEDVVIEAPAIIGKNCWIQAKYIGAFTSINENVQIRYVDSIGKFCSIAQKSEIGLPAHPIQCFSSSDIIYRELKWKNLLKNFEDIEYEKNSKQILENERGFGLSIVIGNDVWIGQGVKIIGNVKIGDGAIIGDGAVVTEDVAPYTIVAGVPAKVIKKRFCDDIIEKLLEIRWWEYGPDILKDIDVTEVTTKQLRKIEKRIIEGFPKYSGVEYRFSSLLQRIYKKEQNKEYVVYSDEADKIELAVISGGGATFDYLSNNLIIYGWCLPSYACDEIKIYKDNMFLGNAILHGKREDVLNNYSQYGDARAGWKFEKNIKIRNSTRLCVEYLKKGRRIYLQNNILCRFFSPAKLLKKYYVKFELSLLFNEYERVYILTDEFKERSNIENIFSSYYQIVGQTETKKYIVCTQNWVDDCLNLKKDGIEAIPFWLFLVCNKNMINYNSLKQMARVMGLDISKLLDFIKEYTYMKIVLIYANCQVMSINSLITTSEYLMKKYVLIEMLPIQSIKTEEKEAGFEELFLKTIDIFIYQNISDENKFSPKLATSKILYKLRIDSQKVCIPNVYFSGYYPQMCSNPYNPYIESLGNGPFPQGDKNIQKLSVEYDADMIADIISKDDFYSREECVACVEKSLLEIKRREEKCDVLISDYIEEHYKDTWLFFTPNHPSNIILQVLVERIFAYLGESITDIKYENAYENDGWQLFIYPSVQKNLELKFRKDKFFYWKVVKKEESDIKDYVSDYIKYCKKQ